MSLSVDDILRYWLAMIQHEEALSAKIRAEAPVSAGLKPNVLQPRRGQPYFKLRCGGDDGAESILTHGEGGLRLSVDSDRAAFFEHWLRNYYWARRTRTGEASTSAAVVIGFPVFHNARRGELATLLRLPSAIIEWQHDGGIAWTAPRNPRRSGPWPPPGWLDLRLAGDDDDGLPYALDEIVLSRWLGIHEEEVGRFVDRLAAAPPEPVAMVRQVIDFLGGTQPPEPPSPAGQDQPGDDREPNPRNPAALVNALAQATQARVLSHDIRVYAMGVAYDRVASYATHYLQRDLQELIRGTATMAPHSACHAYLARQPGPVRRRTHLGRRPQRPLTPTQRDAAERFWGSRCTAVQGPPGTGKTELILALCAHTFIDRTIALGGDGDPSSAGETDPGGGPPGHVPLVVTSTNNRAVDNVIAPLATDLGADLGTDRLPMALRVGSRAAIETATVSILQQAIQWLERAPAPDRLYDGLRERLKACVAAVSAVEDKLLAARAIAAEIEDGERERAAMQHQLAEALAFAEALERGEDQSSPQAVTQARQVISKVRGEIERLHRRRELSPAQAGPGYRISSKRLGRLIGKQLRRSLEALGIDCDDLVAFGQAAEGRASTDPLDVVDDIEDALNEAENQVEECGERADAIARIGDYQRRLSELETALATRRRERRDPAPLAAAVHEVVAAKEEGLFELAAAAREAWAVANREQLLPGLRTAAQTLAENPSLRALERTQRRAFKDLVRLFPVWGCTLLSMGNNFALEDGVIAGLVIDEAGQCHPAHAVSALFRARKVLIIGDVNQLEPVVELGEHEEERVLRRLSLRHQREALGPYRVYDRARTSAQSLASLAATEVPSLRDHFRCQPAIIAVSNELCDYDLVVRTPLASLGQQSGVLSDAMLGIRCCGVQSSHLGSWKNDAEIEIVSALVRTLLGAGLAGAQIAVLTPYYGQMRALQAEFTRVGIPVEGNVDPALPTWQPALPALPGFDLAGDPVAIGTLHRFQGGERDVVVLSTVVSEQRSLWFTNERVNLVNVAVSRARQHLVVVGNPDLLERGAVTGVLVRGIPAGNWLDPTALG